MKQERYINCFVQLFIVVVFLFSVFFSNLAAGWGTEPANYYFHLSCILLSLLLFIKYYHSSQCGQAGITEILIILLGVYILLRQLYMGAAHVLNDLVYSLSVLFLLYFALKLLLLKRFEQTVITLLVAVALCCLIQTGIGASQALRCIINGSTILVTGSYTNPGVFGMYLAASVPALFFLGKLAASRWKRYKKIILVIAGVCCIVCILLLLLSRSRAALISGITATLLVYGGNLYKAITRHPNYLQVLVYAISGIAVALSSFWLYSLKSNSATGRLLIWENSLKMFADNPLTGKGIGGFAREYMYYQAVYFTKHPDSNYLLLADNTVFAFNEILHTAVETGVVGILLVAIVFIICIKGLLSCVQSPAAKPVLVILYTLLTGSLFTYTLHVTGLMLILTAAIAVASSLPQGRRCHNSFKLNKMNLFFMLSAFLLCIFTFFQIRASLYWKRGHDNILERETYALLQYCQADKFLRHRNIFLFNYGVMLYETGRYEEAADILHETEKYKTDALLYMYLGRIYERKKEYVMAEKYYQLAGNMVPKLFYPKFYLLELYRRTGSVQAAKKMAQIIIESPIKAPSKEVADIKRIAKEYLSNL